MDEEQRDIYNRFGGERNTDFDPRKDEMKLISDISVKYLFWMVTAYVMTQPAGARASRTWIAIIGVAILAVEAAFSLTETELPAWAPEQLTEHEVVVSLHCLFPLLVALLRCLAESLYVDVDQTAIAVLKELYLQQKVPHNAQCVGKINLTSVYVRELFVITFISMCSSACNATAQDMNVLLQQLQQLVEIEKDATEGPTSSSSLLATDSVQQVQDIQNNLAKLRDSLEQSSDTTAVRIDALKKCSSNPGANYYWIIFVALYGSMYFLQ